MKHKNIFDKLYINKCIWTQHMELYSHTKLDFTSFFFLYTTPKFRRWLQKCYCTIWITVPNFRKFWRSWVLKVKTSKDVLKAFSQHFFLIDNLRRRVNGNKTDAAHCQTRLSELKAKRKKANLEVEPIQFPLLSFSFSPPSLYHKWLF